MTPQNFPSHPHRLSFSELERICYITDWPFYESIFGRKEPNVGDKYGGDVDETLESKFNVTEIENILAATQRNVKVLKDEILKLNKENLGDLFSEENKDQYLPKLEPVPKE